MVFAFWWTLLTFLAFSMSPLEVIRNWPQIGSSMKLWAIGLVAGALASAWWIWFQRAGMSMVLEGSTVGAIRASLGQVPIHLQQPKRIISPKHQLPLPEPVKKWVAQAAQDFPTHQALFLAIWAIYTAHKAWPASHRRGGHGGRKLWEHCLAVVETALDMAPNWTFTGVYVRSRGRKPRLIISPSRADYEFDRGDPLIPILALAHDLGKIEAYLLQQDGSVLTTEMGTTQNHDDLGIHHDAIGARILARLPEFWALPAADRRILALVIAHYHHPSHFPVDHKGLSIDDRTTTLLEFLIEADKKTSHMETGQLEEEELTEESEVDLYNAFVAIVTEPGRINGIHADSKNDRGFMIGSKHDGLIVIREEQLRLLLLAKLGMHLGVGDNRYRITRTLLTILTEKGLLYSVHEGIDFTHYFPMWEISQRRAKDGGHITNWRPVIILKLKKNTPELSVLDALQDKTSRLRIERPIYTHNINIRNPEALRDLVRKAFGEEIAKSFTIPAAEAPAQAAPQDTGLFVLPLLSSGPDTVQKVEPPPTSDVSAAASELLQETTHAEPTVRTITDQDAPRDKDMMLGPKAQAALQALEVASTQAYVPHVKQTGNKPKTARSTARSLRQQELSLDDFQRAIESQQLKIAGERDGVYWVYEVDLNALFGPFGYVNALKAGLPSHSAGDGMRFIGIKKRTPTNP